MDDAIKYSGDSGNKERGFLLPNRIMELAAWMGGISTAPPHKKPRGPFNMVPDISHCLEPSVFTV
jgi:hypothetical protein